MDVSPQPTSLPNLAIEAALESRWGDALKLNAQIIKTEPSNVDALNRLARAHFELGNLPLAQKYYTQALKFDLYNPIAQKNLKIIKSFKKNKEDFKPASSNGDEQLRISPSLFLQEPGKTKIVNLMKVAEPQKLSTVYCGMNVELTTKNRGITVLDRRNKYLGVLPDDLSFQIIRLIKGGNKYQAFVKSVRVNGLTILVRETFRSKKFKNQPSFLESRTSQSTDMITNYSMDQENEADEAMDQEEGVV